MFKLSSTANNFPVAGRVSNSRSSAGSRNARTVSLRRFGRGAETTWPSRGCSSAAVDVCPGCGGRSSAGSAVAGVAANCAHGAESAAAAGAHRSAPPDAGWWGLSAWHRQPRSARFFRELLVGAGAERAIGLPAQTGLDEEATNRRWVDLLQIRFATQAPREQLERPGRRAVARRIWRRAADVQYALALDGSLPARCTTFGAVDQTMQPVCLETATPECSRILATAHLAPGGRQ
jgi:hypothetical protein